jgi:uracil-DNA glycosylase
MALRLRKRAEALMGPDDDRQDRRGRPGDPGAVSAALAAFRARREARDWLTLRFFTDGSAERVAAAVDARLAGGAQVLPPPDAVFAALTATPFEAVRVVILGQDPYPRPGDAHGLAFSHVGAGRLPPSLVAILREVAREFGGELARRGDLRSWSAQGVLLLNTALTVEAGQAGAHLRLGWDALADQAVAALSRRREAVVFMLWGAPARAKATLVDRTKHLVIECGHPSPLNRARDFPGSAPFSRANAWLAGKGLAPVDWRLP